MSIMKGDKYRSCTDLDLKLFEVVGNGCKNQHKEKRRIMLITFLHRFNREKRRLILSFTLIMKAVIIMTTLTLVCFLSANEFRYSFIHDLLRTY